MSAAAPRVGPLKLAVARALCSAPVGRAVGAVFRDRVYTRGCTIDTSSPAVTPSIKAMLFWGLYESAEVRFVRRWLRPDVDVVELGSSLGVVASHVARRIPGRRLVCVEANPALVDVIARNVRRNAPDVKLTVVNRALVYPPAGDFVDLALGPTNIDSRLAGAGDAGAATTRVPAGTLAGLLAEQALDEYALVCDIEGAEAGIVAHERAALARCRQLIIELHETTLEGRRYTPDALCDALQDRHGFALRDRYGPVCVFAR